MIHFEQVNVSVERSLRGLDYFSKFCNKKSKKILNPNRIPLETFLLESRNVFIKKKKKLYGPFLLFTTKFPEIPGTHFIDLGRMKGWVNLGATQWFWTRDPWIGNPVT